MKYIKIDVPREAGSPGRGIQPKESVTLIDVDDVQYMGQRDEAGVVLAEDIILKDGAYPVKLYMTPGTTEVTDDLKGDPDQEGSTPSVKFNHPGNAQAVREFKANNVGKKFIVIVGYCNGKGADIIGDLCNPCQMTAAYTGNKDSSINEFTFTQISAGNGIGIYKGGIPAVEPVAEVTGSTLTYAASGVYQIADSESVEEIVGGSHGATITIAGPGNVIAGDTILLHAAEKIVLGANSQITLRAYAAVQKVGAGSKLLWIEQSAWGETRV